MKYIKHLSLSQKGKLDELMRKSMDYRVRLRAHCILLSSKKYRIEDLANIFDVDRDTISKWLDNWEKKEFDGLKDAKRIGRPRKKKVKSSE